MATTSDTTAEYQALKRKYDALEVTVAAKDDHAVDSLQLRARQRNLGRGFRRIVHMFDTPRELATCNERYGAAQMSGKELDKDHAVMQKSYQKLVQLIPLVANPHMLQEALTFLYENILRGAAMARSDDASTLKPMVVLWMFEAFGPSIPKLVSTAKDGRGLHNDHTGRLICPCEFNWDDQEVRAAMRANDERYPVTARSWPKFCYFDFTYNPENCEEGLWKNALMVKTFKCIFTSPSSAIDDKVPEQSSSAPTKRLRVTRPTTRQKVASKIGLESVTGRSIAYVAVQLRFALSSASSWNPVDADFCYSTFYAAVVEYFEAPIGPIAAAHVALLLKWWNVQIFGRERGTATVPVRSVRSDSSGQRLKDQRQAKEEAAVTAAKVDAAAQAKAVVDAAVKAKVVVDAVAETKVAVDAAAETKAVDATTEAKVVVDAAAAAADA